MLASDPRRVERILANLIGNAVEHTSSGVVVQVAKDGAQACVEVTDAGPGIPAADVPHVFERFYKADTARAGAGSGLGLAIALENARLLGGNISVRSQVDGGSAFRLTLPMEAAGDVMER
jgi:two-component system sensor histidine kinase MtrB